MKKLTFAFSPCPNDTYIMYAIVHKKINLHGLEFEFVIQDIENLNQAALNKETVITKASAAILPLVKSAYSLLDSGAAFGLEGGPLLISRKETQLNENSIIAIPGELTSAYALFKRYYKKPCNTQFVLFSDIFGLLASERIDAGVVIHEDRFTFWEHGFQCISDLGVEWKNETSLPVPLGVFIASQSLNEETLQLLNLIIRDSIEYANCHYDEAFPWIKEHARNEHPDVIKKHIHYFVNHLSVNMGDVGKEAIKLLYKY